MAGNNDITTRFNLDISGFKKGIADANRQIRVANSEFKAASDGSKEWEESTEGVTAKISSLKKVLDEQNKKLETYRKELAIAEKYEEEAKGKVEKLKKALSDAEKEYGENSDEVKHLREELVKAEQEEATMSTKVDNLTIDMNKQQGAVNNTTRKIDELGNSSSNASTKLANFSKTVIKGIGKGLAIAGTAVATGVGKMLKDGISAFSEYEQIGGGVDKIFKGASDTVKRYALDAYKNQGLTANEYMEQVTSFSSSLIKSLGGDTKKGAEYANKAMTDMSDNANTFGTDIKDIQNAYQGFAKSNYGMLDNLKLGYGGTKSEMQRLVKDAAAIDKSVDANSLSFGNVVKAIHAVQDNMGIAGTTAKEASGTIEGSLNSVKSAWGNLVLATTTNQLDLGQAFGNFSESITNLINNVLPVIQTQLPNIMTTLVSMISTTLPAFLAKLTPIITDLLTKVINLIIQIAPSLLGSLSTIILQLVPVLLNALPQLLNVILQLGSQIINTITQMLPTIIQSIVKIIPQLITALMNNLPVIIKAILGLVNGIISAIPQIVTLLSAQLPTIITSVLDGLLKALPLLVQGLVTLSASLIQNINQIITPILNALPQIVTSIMNAVIQNLPAIITSLVQLFTMLVQNTPVFIATLVKMIPVIIKSLVSTLISLLPLLIQAVKTYINAVVTNTKSVIGKVGEVFKSAVNKIKDVFGTVVSWFSGIWSKIKNVFSSVGSFFAEKFNAAKEKVKEKINPLIEFFGGIWSKIKNKFSSLGSKIGSAIGNGVKTAINGVLSLIESTINNAIDLINGAIKLINKLPGVSVGNVSHVSLPRLERGGILKKGQVGLLEGNGSEAVIPLDRNKKWIASLSKEIIRQTGGINLGNFESNNKNSNDIIFNQTINSPKALSRYDIYRQTQNQISLMKAVISSV